MYCRATSEVRGWVDNKIYSYSDEILKKARDMLYGEGRGRNKSVPDTVLVGRDNNGLNYNTVSFGGEVEVGSDSYIGLSNLLDSVRSALSALVNSEKIEVYSCTIFEDRTGDYILKVRFAVGERKDSGSIYFKIGNINGKAVCSLGSSTGETQVPELNNAVNQIFTMIEKDTVPINSVSVYPLRRIGNAGHPKVYRGYGLAIREYYHDIVLENPGEYRLSGFVECY